MNQNIEDALEILAGVVPRAVNIRIDPKERNLISSLAKQVHKSIPLTDRQLELSLKKIDKYRDGLTKNSVDVDHLLLIKPLRMPLREIDRSQSVTLEHTQGSNKPRIVVKYVFSKKFAVEWGEIEQELIGVQSEFKGYKHISYNEKNIFHLVTKLTPLDFAIDPEILEIYEKIVEIMDTPEKIIPYICVEDQKILAVNTSKTCHDFLSEKFPRVTDENFINFISTAKNCGIFLKSPEIAKKIHNFSVSDLTKHILLEKSTRFRISPDLHDLSSMISSINEMTQWPLLVVVDENNQVFNQVRTIISELSKFVELKEMNVFFRLKNEQPTDQQFNQFVRDNGLNNYIDSNTKVVFITKTRIPKPLLKSDWIPKTALALTSNDFGKLSAYLNDIPNVYYYNNSVTLRHSRVKGSQEIVQL